MKTMTKALIGTVAAGAMALTSAAPAFARDRERHGDGISAGEVIAGALIIGGIAAVASAASKNQNNDYRYNGPYDNRYNNQYNNGYYQQNYRGDYRGNAYGYGNQRGAVAQCVRAAEGDARRSGYRFANVTQIRGVDNRRDGFRVQGIIQVNGQRGYGRNGYSDSGRFTCDVSRGHIVGLDFRGVRGLR